MKAVLVGAELYLKIKAVVIDVLCFDLVTGHLENSDVRDFDKSSCCRHLTFGRLHRTIMRPLESIHARNNRAASACLTQRRDVSIGKLRQWIQFGQSGLVFHDPLIKTLDPGVFDGFEQEKGIDRLCRRGDIPAAFMVAPRVDEKAVTNNAAPPTGEFTEGV